MAHVRYLASLGLVGLISSIALACASTNTDVPSSPVSGADGGGEGSATTADATTGTTGGPCERNADCTDGPTCTTGKCLNGACQYDTLVCPAANECSTNACDPGTNKCKTAPKDDGTDCSVGACKAGTCAEDPSCFGLDPQQYLHCDGSSSTSRDASTSLYDTDRVSTYACASGEVAKEVAFNFDPPAGANVTVSLHTTGGDADLDLLILEDSCTRKSTCMNPAQGGGFAGVTAGTGTESVSFTANAGKTYYVVVDGKVANPVNFHVAVTCN